MSITLSPAKAAYLARVTEGLADLRSEDREEIIQDLEAHLAELDDDEVEPTLGTAAEFVAEFRLSAGLSTRSRLPRFTWLHSTRAELAVREKRISELVQWPRLRPAWIWLRGWLLVSAWGLLYYSEGFVRFPIPQFGGSTLTGLVLIAVATLASVRLENGPPLTWKRRASRTFSVLAVLATVASVANPIYHNTQGVTEDPLMYIDRLTAADGATVTNIYAYDLEGNPVEVLLFDQEGRPLLTFPAYVYDEAENAGTETSSWDGGTVTFTRDENGRIIPNLYPLTLEVYDDYGGQAPMPPPSIGFPSVEEETPTGSSQRPPAQ